MNEIAEGTDHLSTPQIQRLVERLTTDLACAYKSTTEQVSNGSEPLRDACERYGTDAASGGISLEEAMSGAIGALQGLFDRVGGHASDPATVIAAGIGLAAIARSYEASGGSIRAERRQTDDLPPQVARLEALHRINRTATANLKLSEMLETTVRVVAETTRSDACAVFLYDTATDSLALRAAVGLNPASVGAMTIRPGSGITGRAAAEGRPVVAPDARTHENWVSSAAFGDGVYTSQISVPMLYHGANRLVGVLNILSVARREFDEDDLAFLQTVAGELAISIENARLYSRTDARLRRKVAELGTLQRVSRTVASSLDQPHVLRSIAEAAVELTNAEAAAIFRLPRPEDGRSDSDQSPSVAYRVGHSREAVDASSRDDLVLEVIESGTAQAAEMEYLDGTGRLYCLPLHSAREKLGALCLRLAPDTELTEDELGLLQAFTDSAAIAIENAELYENARHSLETASTLLQEMHHRVRNNLQTVAALLSIQLRQLSDEPAAVHLREAISRIQAIAAVHDLLSDERRLGGATIDAIARLVAEEAHSTLIPPGLHVEFAIPKSEIEVPSKQATVLALLTNELVSNAVTHGFRGRARGRVTIRALREGNLATLEVANDGQRVPEGFDPQESRGLGMRIVQRLVSSDLRGEFSIQSNDEGTVAAITFPVQVQ
ncbi:MAG TPA: GAF domain-containing protein [Thermomicrobiales bacterium]|nr:GAF domain-containing protein [Thermomicrobiales bacterium]